MKIRFPPPWVTQPVHPNPRLTRTRIRWHCSRQSCEKQMALAIATPKVAPVGRCKFFLGPMIFSIDNMGVAPTFQVLSIKSSHVIPRVFFTKQVFGVPKKNGGFTRRKRCCFFFLLGVLRVWSVEKYCRIFWIFVAGRKKAFVAFVCIENWKCFGFKAFEHCQIRIGQADKGHMTYLQKNRT